VCARRISEGTQQPQPQSPNIAAAQYELGVRISWQRRTELSTEHKEKEMVIKGGIKGIADALAQSAADHGLTVGMQNNNRHVVLSRT